MNIGKIYQKHCMFWLQLLCQFSQHHISTQYGTTLTNPKSYVRVNNMKRSIGMENIAEFKKIVSKKNDNLTRIEYNVSMQDLK